MYIQIFCNCLVCVRSSWSSIFYCICDRTTLMKDRILVSKTKLMFLNKEYTVLEGTKQVIINEDYNIKFTSTQ